METYLLKFSACLFVFWLIYALFLEREQMHRLKRFYLLGAVVLALAIPLLTITYYIEPVVPVFDTTQTFIPTEASYIAITEDTLLFWNLEKILWLIYGIGVLLFSTRFIVNLVKMYTRISEHTKVSERSFIYVLLQELRIPHSFFKYIFLNQTKYEAELIPKEVILHEETHAKQLHSIDILIIELLQVVFWFHPLIYILKHHIKLNHEFLADQAVLQEGVDTKTYQNILLQFSSNTDEYQLSSTINYSSIKKRFTVMKTQTSKTRIWLSSLLLLPIIAILFYSFSTKEYIEKESITKVSHQNEESIEDTQDIYNPSFLDYIIEMEKEGATFYLDDEKITAKKAKSIATDNKGKRTEMITQKDADGKYIVKLSSAAKNNHYAKSIDLKILNDGSYLIDDIKATKRTFTDVFNQLHQDITPEVRNNIMNIHVSSSQEISNKETWFIYNALQDYGFYRIVTPNQEINRAKGNTPFAIESSLLTQEKATTKQVAAYNAWAKKINNTDIGDVIIKKKELAKYKRIYGLMTNEQKKNAEPFPQLPPPPPPPPSPKVKKGEPSNIAPPPPPPPPIKNGKVTEGQIKAYNNWIATLKDPNGDYKMIKKQDYEYFMSIYKLMTDDQKKKTEGLPPPPPPAPESTLDFVIRMAKANAKFIDAGKIISSDTAIALVKNNPKLNVSAKKTDTKQPIVYFHERPMTIDVNGKVGKHISEAQKDNLPIVNGNKIESGKLSMTITELKKLNFTLLNGEVTRFKLKIPGIKTQQITGNSITTETLQNLLSTNTGDVIAIFDIKDNKSTKFSPLEIKIIE